MNESPDRRGGEGRGGERLEGRCTHPVVVLVGITELQQKEKRHPQQANPTEGSHCCSPSSQIALKRKDVGACSDRKGSDLETPKDEHGRWIGEMGFYLLEPISERSSTRLSRAPWRWRYLRCRFLPCEGERGYAGEDGALALSFYPTFTSISLCCFSHIIAPKKWASI